jgi:hypothetical protein
MATLAIKPLEQNAIVPFPTIDPSERGIFQGKLRLFAFVALQVAEVLREPNKYDW